MSPARRPSKVRFNLIGVERSQPSGTTLSRPTKDNRLPQILRIAIAGVKEGNTVVPIRHGCVSNSGPPATRRCRHHGAGLRA